MSMRWHISIVEAITARTVVLSSISSTKDLPVFTMSNGQLPTMPSDEYPLPKSSSRTFAPVSRICSSR
ncbi:MAG: hypothetical protein SPG07_01480 [Coriobacteriales bacterium]|nr:hypothetical protein [Coriobacteriales bacterium]MDY5661282.1 hypothetical protein [Coriobacteriales bacterium]